MRINPEDHQNLIAEHLSVLLTDLGCDLKHPSMKRTPQRVAKMYLTELFKSLYENEPVIMAQPNDFKYDQMLITANIEVISVCEHHLVPMIGRAHIAYIPDQKVMGLSKFNRLVNYHSASPQVQERLTQIIHKRLTEILVTQDVAVILDLLHLCVKIRGVRDDSVTRSSAISGAFRQPEVRSELFRSIPTLAEFKIL